MTVVAAPPSLTAWIRKLDPLSAPPSAVLSAPTFQRRLVLLRNWMRRALPAALEMPTFATEMPPLASFLTMTPAPDVVNWLSISVKLLLRMSPHVLRAVPGAGWVSPMLGVGIG